MKSEKSAKSKKASQGKRTPEPKSKLRSNSGQESPNVAEAEKEVKNLGGRPSEFTQEKAAEFCKRVSQGRMVRDVCNDPDMPTSATFYKWLEGNEQFLKQYTRAKEIQADAMAADILRISDTADADNVCDEYGNIKPNHEWIARSKLRVDARKWLLSKMLPKKYGDKVEQTVIGDPEKPVHHKVDVDVKAMTPEQLKDFIRSETHGQK